MWAWQERQAKFITNSVRAYEYWGLDWWLPLWDAEYMAFWQHVPLSQRTGKRLARRHVTEAYEREIGRGNTTSLTNDRGSKSILRTAVRGSRLYRPLLHAHVWMMSIGGYWRHPLAWYGIHSFFEHMRSTLASGTVFGGHFSINTIISEEMLRSLSERDISFDTREQLT